MATNYPGSLDTSGSQLRTDIASTDDMNASGKEHHLMHVNVHGAAIALETKLGTGSSTASTGAVLMGTGSGASAWDTSPTILGALTVGADGSGHDVTFYSGTAGDSFVWDSSEEKLTITGTNGQVALAVADGNVSIADDLDVDGTLEADAITVDGTALSEYIADTVGAMVGSNTETNITVTYEDSDNTLDFVIGTLNQDTTGNAATATALETARTINGVSFDGTGNVTVTAAAGTLTGGTLASGVTASDLNKVSDSLATDSGTNLVITSDGYLKKDSSSIRYKNVADVDMDDHLTASMIDSLEPKMFSYKSDDSNHPMVGLIAEDCDSVSPFLAVHNNNGQSETTDKNALISLLIIALKDARTRISALES